MAIATWNGDAASVSEDHTNQVTVDDAATTYEVTLNGKQLDTAGTGTGVNDTAAAIASAINNTTIPDFALLSATSVTDTVHVTTVDPNEIVSLTWGTTGGTGLFGGEVVVAGSSNRNFANADNWIGGTIWADGDDLTLTGANVGPTLNIAPASTLPSGTLQIQRSFESPGEVGLPEYVDGSKGRYRDPRNQYLTAEFATAYIGLGEGTMSGRIMLDFLDAPVIIRVLSTGNPVNSNQGAVQILTNHASATLDIHSGVVEVAALSQDTATIGTIRNLGGELLMRRGTTVTTVESSSTSRLEVFSGITNLTVNSGTTTVDGNGANEITNVTIERNATLVMLAANELNTITIKGTLDISEVPVYAAQPTTINVHKGATIIDPNQVLDFSALAMQEGGTFRYD